MGTNDRAPRHMKAQGCFSISIQVTKAGGRLSNFIPGPQGISCSPSRQRFLLSWNTSLLILSYFSATPSVNSPLCSGPPWLSFLNLLSTLNRLSEHDMSFHSRACRKVFTTESAVSAPARHCLHSNHADQGSLKVAGQIKSRY